MAWPDHRTAKSLDEFITGHYGEDQFVDPPDDVIDMVECNGCGEMVEEDLVVKDRSECYHCHEEGT